MLEGSQTWHVRLDRLDVDSMLAAECGALVVTIRKSGIPRPNAGLGLFTAKDFGTGKNIELYYGILVYSNLVNENQKWKAYGERIIPVTVQTFTK